MPKPEFRNWIVNIGLFIATFILFTATLEFGYRIQLFLFRKVRPVTISYRVSQQAHSFYDAQYGFYYGPNTKMEFFYVKDGVVDYCPGVVAFTNRDGFSGLTTVEDYNRSDLKILVLGDSFTRWSRNGKTWPDLLEEKLEEQLGISVGVLNQARSGYGVLQMFDLAAGIIEEYKPDLVIFAMISADFKRDRWWAKAILDQGYARPLLSHKKDNFDLTIAKDEYLVHPEVNWDWCQKNLKKKVRDPLLEQLERQYLYVRDSIRKAHLRQFLSLGQMYLLNRILHGDPFAFRRRGLVPRTTLSSYLDDARFVEDVRRIDSFSMPYMLVHLPLKHEIEVGVHYKEKGLVESLEKATQKKIIYLHEGVTPEQRRIKFSNSPVEEHPTFEGLGLYADLIANAVQDLLKTEKIQF